MPSVKKKKDAGGSRPPRLHNGEYARPGTLANFVPDRYNPYVARYDRPKLRTRTSGLVGPELDWSVRHSDIPMTFVSGYMAKRLGYFNPIGSHEDSWFSLPKEAINAHDWAKYRPTVGCVRTYNMTDFGVQAWTKFCMLEGIQYQGDFKYILPGKNKLARPQRDVPREQRKEFFRAQKAAGLIPRGKRSEAAIARRAMKRSARELTPGPIVVTRYNITQSDIIGWKTQLNCTFRKARAVVKKLRKPIPCLRYAKGKPLPIPDTVHFALAKIYANPVRLARVVDFENPHKVLEVPIHPERTPFKVREGAFGHLFYEYGVSPRSTIPNVRASDFWVPMEPHRTTFTGRTIMRYKTPASGKKPILRE